LKSTLESKSIPLWGSGSWKRIKGASGGEKKKLAIRRMHTYRRIEKRGDDGIKKTASPKTADDREERGCCNGIRDLIGN